MGQRSASTQSGHAAGISLHGYQDHTGEMTWTSSHLKSLFVFFPLLFPLCCFAQVNASKCRVRLALRCGDKYWQLFFSESKLSKISLVMQVVCVCACASRRKVSRRGPEEPPAETGPVRSASSRLLLPSSPTHCFWICAELQCLVCVQQPIKR